MDSKPTLKNMEAESAIYDEREIYGIHLNNGKEYYLNNYYSKIECIKEYGWMYYVPWFAIWVGDKLYARINGAYVDTIIYSRQNQE